MVSKKAWQWVLNHLPRCQEEWQGPREKVRCGDVATHADDNCFPYRYRCAAHAYEGLERLEYADAVPVLQRLARGELVVVEAKP
jgi:hypothetical protein